jgi:hypothetical protein
LRQLTRLDATFLNRVSATTFGHVSQLMVLDPSTRRSGELTVEDVKAGVQERLRLLRPFRDGLRESLGELRTLPEAS